jgi:hypothetical protein
MSVVKQTIDNSGRPANHVLSPAGNVNPFTTMCIIRRGVWEQRESLYPPGARTLVWQSGITRFQSHRTKTLGYLKKVASGRGSLVTSRVPRPQTVAALPDT